MCFFEYLEQVNIKTTYYHSVIFICSEIMFGLGLGFGVRQVLVARVVF